MEISGMQRRRAAILIAEVVGYGDLADRVPDDIRRLRRELIEPTVEAYEGRQLLVKGDIFVAEFATAAEAVSCAVEIQRAQAAPEAEMHEAQVPHALQLRIGVNLGELSEADGTLSGDALTIGARVADWAEPGGICINRTVLSQVKTRTDIGFVDLGEMEVSDVPQPVRVLSIQLEPHAAAQATHGALAASQASASVRFPWYRHWQALALGVAVVAFVASAGLWLFGRGPTMEPAAPERMAFALPDKPSIAVLPFDNLSDDPSQRHLAHGLTDDLIADLSQLADLFVIARHSTFVYDNRPAPAHQVAESLGVRYLVDGSVRRTGGALRVNARLIDAIEGEIVWTERFDEDVAGLFAVQNSLMHDISEALSVDMTPQQAAAIAQGRTDDMLAWEAFQKGWDLYLNFNAEDAARAIPYLEEAIDLDPDYGRAYAALSLAYHRIAEWAWSHQDALSFSDAWSLARFYLEQALRRPTSLAHIASATDHIWQGRADAAFNEALRAMVLDSNDPEAHLALAWAMIVSGRSEEAIGSIETALRLNPVRPARYDLARAMAHFAMADYAQAAEVLSAAVQRHPGATELAPPLAASYAYLERREDARTALSTWKPNVGEEELQAVAATYRFPVRWTDGQTTVQDRLLDGVRIAALPPDEDVPKLLGDLSDDNVLVRLGATQKLGWFRDQAKDAVPHLIPILADENDGVRKEAALALGKIGPSAKAAIPALEAAKEDPELEPFAADALKGILGQ